MASSALYIPERKDIAWDSSCNPGNEPRFVHEGSWHVLLLSDTKVIRDRPSGYTEMVWTTRQIQTASFVCPISKNNGRFERSGRTCDTVPTERQAERLTEGDRP
jgi:hypothetical protein